MEELKRDVEVHFCKDCGAILIEEPTTYEDGCPNCEYNVALDGNFITGLFTAQDAEALLLNGFGP